MSANPFDQFDQSNPFDQFDAPAKQVNYDILKSGDARTAYAKGKASLAQQTARMTPQQRADAMRRYEADPRVQKLRQASDRNDSKVGGFVAGLLKPLDNLSTAAMNIPGMAALDNFGKSIGLPGQADAVAGNNRARAANTRTGYQLLGNIGGTLPTLALPGGAVAQGAASGALLSDADSVGGVVKDATIGGFAGKAGQVIGKTVAGAIAPRLAPAARKLADANIPLTLGQFAQSGRSAVGKGVRGLEDKARSIPGLGMVIGGSRDRSAHALNRAVAEDVVSSIGGKLPPKAVGHELIDSAEQSLSSRYKDVVPRLVGNFDNQFATDLAGAKSVTNVLPTARQTQFKRILVDVFGNRATDNGRQITGQQLKDAESRLTKLAGDYAKSTDADQRIMADALFKVRTALRDVAVRSDKSGSELQAINQGWAKLHSMKKAAGSSGVVTPKALQRVAEKTGFNKDLARAAAELLPDHVPNTGTADRAAMMLMLKDGVGAGAVGGSALLGHPGILAGGLAAAAPYTKLGQAAINKLLTAPRGKAAVKLSDLVRKLSDRSPGTISAFATQVGKRGSEPPPEFEQ